MRFYLFCFFLLLYNVSYSQVFPSDIWYEGRVYLDSQQTLTGHIKYDFDNDLIQVNHNNLIKTFSTRKFISFEFTDAERRVTRSFYSLPYFRVSNYKVPMLFELIKEGKNLSLLTREYITTESVPQYDYYSHRNYYFNRTVIAYNYYFLFPNGKIRQYHFNKSELLDLLKDKAPDIKKFVKEHRLRYDKKDDLIEIVNYYNTLNK